MYTRLPQVWPVSEKDLRILKGPRPGKREGQTSQEVHRNWLSVSTSQPIPCLSSMIMYTSQTALEILHRERVEKAGFYMLSCLNNDVGAMNRGAHYSPWSFGSWPVASPVKTPVSNDPCQRLPHTAVMTYHTSSLRPHTDNYNHIYSFCCRIRLLLWQIDMVMRDTEVGEGAGGVEEKKRARAGEYVQARSTAMRDDCRHLVRNCSISVPYTGFHSSCKLLFIHPLAP